MKSIYISVILVVFAFMGVKGQESAMTSKELKEKNKVEIYSDIEKSNFQVWFNEESKRFIPNQELRDEYYAIVLYYTVKMKRLNDLDKGLEEKGIYPAYLKLQKKSNKEVKQILNDTQYHKHIEIMEKVNKSVLDHLNRK